MQSDLPIHFSVASGLGVVLTKPFSTSKSLNILYSYMCTKNDISVTLLYSTIDTTVKMGWIFPETYLQQIQIPLKKKKGISIIQQNQNHSPREKQYALILKRKFSISQHFVLYTKWETKQYILDYFHLWNYLNKDKIGLPPKIK